MSKEASRIYVGCALTQGLETFTTEVEAFKQRLQGEGYEVFNFVGLENGTAADVYEWDINHCVRDCDIFVGVCDYPSIGLGWELGEATRLGKSVLAIAHEDSKVTRLVLGAAAVEPNVRFEYYEQMTDMLPIIDELTASRAE